jgi:hypothetical protein
MGLMDSNDVRVAEVVGTKGLRVVAHPIPGDLSIDAQVTAGHEAAHGFGLDDEYGSKRVAKTQAEFDAANAAINVQDVKSATATPASKGLDPTKLKWNFPRIVRAGVLDAPPALAGLPPGRRFLLALRKGHAKPFRKGDTVQLRTRPLTATTTPSGELTVVDDPTGDQLLLEPLGGTVLNPASFPAGSVVYVPKKSGGAVLGLISPKVIAHMRTTGIPLNVAPVAVASYTCDPQVGGVQEAKSRPAG